MTESELCNTDVPQHNSRYYLNLIYAVILSPPQIQVCITILLHYSILWSAFPTPEKISLSIIILPIGIFLFTNTYLGQRFPKKKGMLALHMVLASINKRLLYIFAVPPSSFIIAIKTYVSLTIGGLTITVFILSAIVNAII